LISTHWLAKRRPHWARLEHLVAVRAGRSVNSLSPGELQELALLYRQTASDLSAVRQDESGGQLAIYLNQLMARAHNLIYMGRRAKPKGIWAFYKDGFPAIFRETLPDTLAAFIIFLAAGVASFLVALADPAFPRYLLGGQMMDTIQRHEMWTHSIVTVKPLASSFILTNNLTVSFTTFALGITAGIGTVWMMVLNGLLIGTVGEACWKEGMSLQLWSFVAAHGVLELPAIFIAGGAGFGIARGLLFPGRLSRRASLAAAGSRSVRLVLGTIPLLLIAGFLEGFVSPTAIPVAVKFGVAGVMALLLILYLSRTGAPAAADGAVDAARA